MTPTLAITSGDPAGVGPELCIRLLEQLGESRCGYRPIVIGDWQHTPRLHAHHDQLAAVGVEVFEDWEQSLQHDGPSWFDPRALKRPVAVGQIDAEAGRASFHYVESAIDAALAGTVDAVVTGPIHKQAWQQAGIQYPGHTELFVERTGTARHAMMLTSPEVTCSLVTTHCGIRDVATLLTTERIVEVIRLTYESVRAWRQGEPTIGVLGLNPHAGEGGRFGGGEEERIIQPAIEAACAEGVRAVGPLSPDTAFLAPKRSAIDAYVCMYHDQGLIPLKTLDFERGVNVTLGLPIVRTSVDHGPAFDLAGSWRASHKSLAAALELAARWVQGSMHHTDNSHMR